MQNAQGEATGADTRMQQISDEVRAYIVDTFLFGKGGETLRADASLMEAGIVDSTGILELVSFLEETWEFQVDDEDLVPENLDSINNISTYIIRKVQQ